MRCSDNMAAFQDRLARFHESDGFGACTAGELSPGRPVCYQPTPGHEQRTCQVSFRWDNDSNSGHPLLRRVARPDRFATTPASAVVHQFLDALNQDRTRFAVNQPLADIGHPFGIIDRLQ